MYDTVREIVGGSSGAVLGYITGDLRGAIKGWEYGRKLSKKPEKMSPVPKESAKRKNNEVMLYGGKRVKLDHRYSKMMRARSKKVYRSSGGGGGYKGRTLRRAKRVYKRKVKVSKKLREKIKKVITGTKPTGHFQEVFYDDINFFDSESNRQMINQISGFTGSSTDALFSPSRVMDAASVLWNQKTMERTGKTITDLDNFDSKKLKVKVKKSSQHYTIRNNTQRGVTIKLIECEPKSYQVQGSPIGVWQAAMSFQALNEGPNQAGASLTEIHTHPTILPDFNRLFKTRTSTYHLCPGQEIGHTVLGPKDKLYDFQKFWNGSTFQPNCPGSKWVLAVYYVDMVTQYTPGVAPSTLPGRIMDFNTDSDNKFNLIVEGISRYELEMPDMTGFIGPVLAAPDATDLDQRQFSYAFKTYFTTQVGIPGPGVEIYTVLEENPISVVLNPEPNIV